MSHVIGLLASWPPRTTAVRTMSYRAWRRASGHSRQIAPRLINGARAKRATLQTSPANLFPKPAHTIEKSISSSHKKRIGSDAFFTSRRQINCRKSAELVDQLLISGRPRLKSICIWSGQWEFFSNGLVFALALLLCCVLAMGETESQSCTHLRNFKNKGEQWCTKIFATILV
jgi:hypothetical protein